MVQAVKRFFKRISDWYRALPEKKKYIEFVTALLSVPVMLTIIVINLNNLKQSKNTSSNQENTNSTTPIQVIITGDTLPIPSQNPSVATPTITSTISSPTTVECKKQIGPVIILSPQESEIVTKDTVCITISTDSSYCPPTWSYSLNGGSWSDYTDKNICLYNLESGNKTIQLRVKNSTSDETIELQRSFIYKNPNMTPTQSPSPTVSQ